jgi:hypothetical protein
MSGPLSGESSILRAGRIPLLCGIPGIYAVSRIVSRVTGGREEHMIETNKIAQAEHDFDCARLVMTSAIAFSYDGRKIGKVVEVADEYILIQKGSFFSMSFTYRPGRCDGGHSPQRSRSLIW